MVITFARLADRWGITIAFSLIMVAALTQCSYFKNQTPGQISNELACWLHEAAAAGSAGFAQSGDVSSDAAIAFQSAAAAAGTLCLTVPPSAGNSGAAPLLPAGAKP